MISGWNESAWMSRFHARGEYAPACALKMFPLPVPRPAGNCLFCLWHIVQSTAKLHRPRRRILRCNGRNQVDIPCPLSVSLLFNQEIKDKSTDEHR